MTIATIKKRCSHSGLVHDNHALIQHRVRNNVYHTNRLQQHVGSLISPFVCLIMLLTLLQLNPLTMTIASSTPEQCTMNERLEVNFCRRNGVESSAFINTHLQKRNDRSIAKDNDDYPLHNCHKQQTYFNKNMPGQSKLFFVPALPSCKRWMSSSSLKVSNNSEQDDNNKIDDDSDNDEDVKRATYVGVEPVGTRKPIRRRVKELARSIMPARLTKTASAAISMPQAVAAVLKDATFSAVEMAVDEIMSKRREALSTFYKSSEDNDDGNNKKKKITVNNNKEIMHSLMITSLIDQAFLPMEASLDEMEASLQIARESLQMAKQQAVQAMLEIQNAAIGQAAARAVAIVVEEEQNATLASLTYDDVNYSESEMAPPFIDEGQCLVPGEPVIRVEKAPENSRRIFAGIDIMASVDTVWNVLTDYANLQNVVPNLVVNEVLEIYKPKNKNAANGGTLLSSDKPEEEQCRVMCEQMNGSLLRQVGGAKVAGIQFSARTTLEVREWPNGMPDFAHFADAVYNGESRTNRAKQYTQIPLERYRFPRPFAISSLPTKDISMQSIENDDGEFRMYQGVWRMQPLPGCAPPGQQAMRLTYAVQVSPRAYLPVQLIEGRIVRDLCTNLVAIRDYVAELQTSAVTKTMKR